MPGNSAYIPIFFKLLYFCFQADSIGFVGQKHKWAVTQLLIKGNNKTHETMLNNLANSIYLLGKYYTYDDFTKKKKFVKLIFFYKNVFYI